MTVSYTHLVPAEYVSRFAYVVYGKGYIHDFVDGFMRRNRDREIVPGSFALSDADYADFTAFMQDKDVEWESDTKRLLARLKESALSLIHISAPSRLPGTIG